MLFFFLQYLYTLFILERDYYAQTYRPMAYLIWTAVAVGRLTELVTRVREINGELVAESAEVFKPGLFKDYATGLNQTDMVTFLDWLTASSLVTVNGKDKISAKLKELKKQRMAYFHVFCPDGRVAEKLSMFHADSA